MHVKIQKHKHTCTLTSEPLLSSKSITPCTSARTNQADDMPSTWTEEGYRMKPHNAPIAFLAASLAAEATAPVSNGPFDGTGSSPCLCNSAKSSWTGTVHQRNNDFAIYIYHTCREKTKIHEWNGRSQQYMCMLTHVHVCICVWIIVCLNAVFVYLQIRWMHMGMSVSVYLHPDYVGLCAWPQTRSCLGQRRG